MQRSGFHWFVFWHDVWDVFFCNSQFYLSLYFNSLYFVLWIEPIWVTLSDFSTFIIFSVSFFLYFFNIKNEEWDEVDFDRLTFDLFFSKQMEL